VCVCYRGLVVFLIRDRAAGREGWREGGLVYLQGTLENDAGKGRLELAAFFPLGILQESALGGVAGDVPRKRREGGREGGREGWVGGWMR